MNQISLVNEQSMNNLMTTLDIAELTGKRHADVMRDVRHEIEELGVEIGERIFAHTSYKDKSNRDSPCYKFGKEGAMQLALKYDAKTRYKVIKRIEMLEQQQNTHSYMIEDPVERAKRWIIEQQEKQLLIAENSVKDQLIGELKPKADYTDKILQSTGLMTITQIAKDYGMSAQKMNAILHELKVQYSQNRQWLLYSKYHAEGYTHSETIPITHSDGTPGTKLNTKWTQKGRLFLYQLLKKNGILPTIEKRNEV